MALTEGQLTQCARAFVAQGWKDGVPEEERETAKNIVDRFSMATDTWSGMNTGERRDVTKLVRMIRKPKSGKTRKPRDPDAPKGARSAYIFFHSEFSKTCKGKASDVSARWKELTEEEKQVYVDKATEDKVRYQKERKDYRERTRCCGWRG